MQRGSRSSGHAPRPVSSVLETGEGEARALQFPVVGETGSACVDRSRPCRRRRRGSGGTAPSPSASHWNDPVSDLLVLPALPDAMEDGSSSQGAIRPQDGSLLPLVSVTRRRPVPSERTT